LAEVKLSRANSLLSPLFSTIEKYVFAFVIILYPIPVLIKKNIASFVAVFVLLFSSGLVHGIVEPASLFDVAIVFVVYSVALFGFKMLLDSWKCRDGKKAWVTLALSFVVLVAMWACLELLAASEGHIP
jgi:hypothetical protein